MWWESKLFQVIPLFVNMYTVNCLHVINEIHVEWEIAFSRFFHKLSHVKIWSLVLLSFLSPACTSTISVSNFCFILSAIIFSKILVIWDIRNIVLQFSHLWRSSSLGIGIYTALHQSFGHFSVFHVRQHSLCIVFTEYFPPFFTSSIGI